MQKVDLLGWLKTKVNMVYNKPLKRTKFITDSVFVATLNYTFLVKWLGTKPENVSVW